MLTLNSDSSSNTDQRKNHFRFRPNINEHLDPPLILHVQNVVVLTVHVVMGHVDAPLNPG